MSMEVCLLDFLMALDTILTSFPEHSDDPTCASCAKRNQDGAEEGQDGQVLECKDSILQRSLYSDLRSSSYLSRDCQAPARALLNPNNSTQEDSTAKSEILKH